MHVATPLYKDVSFYAQTREEKRELTSLFSRTPSLFPLFFRMVEEQEKWRKANVVLYATIKLMEKRQCQKEKVSSDLPDLKEIARKDLDERITLLSNTVINNPYFTDNKLDEYADLMALVALLKVEGLPEEVKKELEEGEKRGEALFRLFLPKEGLKQIFDFLSEKKTLALEEREEWIAIKHLLKGTALTLREKVDGDRFSLLHLAAYKGEGPLIRKLLRGLQYQDRLTLSAKMSRQLEMLPLHVALFLNRADAVGPLCEFLSSNEKFEMMTTKMEEGLTPLHVGAVNGAFEAIEKMFQKCPSYIRTPEKYLTYPEENLFKKILYDKCCENNDFTRHLWDKKREIISAGHGALKKVKDKEGKTAYDLALEWGHEEASIAFLKPRSSQ